MVAVTSEKFRYKAVNLGDIKVVTEPSKVRAGRNEVKEVVVEDEKFKPSNRFWTSLHARFGLPSNIYKYFDHNEVFQRVNERDAHAAVRLTIEEGQKGRRGTLLGATNPMRPIVSHKDLMDILGNHSVESQKYHDGIVTSTHKLKNSDEFDILGDTFENQFTMSTPIDGYGMPNIYLSMLRMVCSNGMVAYSKAFRTALKLGRGDDDVTFAIDRAIDSFNNEEGFSALRQRMESGGQSWASLNETYNLTQLLHRAKLDDEIDNGKELLESYRKLTGDIATIYGLAQLNELTRKKMRALPSKATVYDLVNFATEVATHHAKDTYWSRKFHSFVGDIIGQEYDLEGTVKQYPDFKDWFAGKN